MTRYDRNGQHLFVCEGQLYFTEIFDLPDTEEGVGVSLFIIQRSSDGVYSVLPISSIGQYSLYIGANQSFVLPAQDPLIRRHSNTLYVEDFSSKIRNPRVLGLEAIVIPYPDNLAVDIEE